MGIHGLTKLLGDNAPNSMKEDEIKNYFGRKIAIDASMSLYQFLIAVRPDNVGTLTDETGAETSHLQGMFHRTIRMMKNGMKPVFVFDGKPPQLKSDELSKRKEKRDEAIEGAKEAKETGNVEEQAKLTKRTVRVTKQHNEDVKKLLRLMGVPVIDAPSEAEAQCAALAKAGAVFATGTEDMDSLTFGTGILLRHLTYSEARKQPIKEIHLAKVLEELKLNMDEFIDLCILLGCDYCDSIRGIGPVRALELIRQHKNIEAILKAIAKQEKYEVPENWNFQGARELFKNPEVTDPINLQLIWKDADEEGLMQYLVKEKGFSEDRVKSGIEKLKKAKSSSVQGRLTSFFGEPKLLQNKRKLENEAKERENAKKQKREAEKAKKKAKQGIVTPSPSKKKK